MVGYILENTNFFFLHGALEKVQNVILITYDAGTDNKHTLHLEGNAFSFTEKAA